MTTHEFAVPPPPPAKRRGRSYMVWGCLALALIGLLLIGSCVAFLFHGKRTVEPYADEFFNAWDQEDYESLYAMTSSQVRAEQPKEALLSKIRALRTQLGRTQERNFRGINVHTGAEGSLASVMYNALFENGEGIVRLTMVEEGDAWRVQTLDIDSDALAAQPCPQCGHPNPVGSNFCSQCGQALTANAEGQ